MCVSYIVIHVCCLHCYCVFPWPRRDNANASDKRETWGQVGSTKETQTNTIVLTPVHVLALVMVDVFTTKVVLKYLINGPLYIRRSETKEVRHCKQLCDTERSAYKNKCKQLCEKHERH